MPFARAGITIASDETRIVNRFGDGQNLDVATGKITDAIEVEHLVIGKQEGVHRTVFGSGEADDLSGRVRAERAALSTAERPNISHAVVGIAKRVISSCSLNVSSASGLRVNRGGRTAGSAKRPEIVHGAVGIKECVIRTISNLGEADDLPGWIYGAGGTGRAAQRS